MVNHDRPIDPESVCIMLAVTSNKMLVVRKTITKKMGDTNEANRSH